MWFFTPKFHYLIAKILPFGYLCTKLDEKVLENAKKFFRAEECEIRNTQQGFLGVGHHHGDAAFVRVDFLFGIRQDESLSFQLDFPKYTQCGSVQKPAESV